MDLNLGGQCEHSFFQKVLTAYIKVFSIWGDIIGFTEVFWKQQVAYISNLAEQRWYHAIAYPAFEMTSQSEEWEHLYNILLSREYINPNNICIDNFRHPRPDFHKLVTFLEKIPLWKKWSLNGTFWYPTEEANSDSVRNAHKRLLDGVLDGAFMTATLENGISITHGHTHGIWLANYLDKQNPNKPHVLLLDANKHPSYYPQNAPVFSHNYQSLIPINKDTRTYMHAKWWFWENIGKQVSLTHPDIAFGNKLVTSTSYKVFETLSDHHWIQISIKENWKS
jgi:hypothetical protein